MRRKVKTKIKVLKGDITKLDVDCIVNAAHEALMGGGGVDGAIHRAAGPSLMSACREIKQVEPGVRCKVGEAHLTSGFNLPSKYIIHTVAPKWVGGIMKRKRSGPNDLRESDFLLTRNLYKCAKEGTEEDLRKCYRNCLKLAVEHGVKSIAFPSLGTGGHAFPIELASVEATDEVASFLSELHDEENTLEEIYFVCFSDHDYGIYVEAVKITKGE